MVFEGCFENNAEEHMVSYVSGDGGHRFGFKDRSIFDQGTKG